jgi:N-acetyl-alpha-D-muramate 1-phosphate uridylyltransferase
MADSVAPPAPDPEPSLAAVVLAAGAGERLRPLTRLRPKPLCPVANVALLDDALRRVSAVVRPGSVAVNVHHHRTQMEEHLAARPDVHVSVEPDQARGTAGALGLLKDWLDGRAVLVVNGDSWSAGELNDLVTGWDGERVRMLVHAPEGHTGAPRAAFDPHSLVVASLLPAWAVESLDPEPSGLYERCWRPAQAAGRLETVTDPARFIDCGTPATYLQANLLAGPVTAPDAVIAPGVTILDSAIGAGAVVEGDLIASVVWPGARVNPGERLVRSVRASDRVTVAVR